MNMIITSECEQCIHSIIDETNKAKVKIYCKAKDKTYYFGQCIPCEDKKLIVRSENKQNAKNNKN